MQVESLNTTAEQNPNRKQDFKQASNVLTNELNRVIPKVGEYILIFSPQIKRQKKNQ